MKEILENLKRADNLRTLKETKTLQKYIINSNKQYINLSSNDYLGLSDSDLQRQFIDTVDFNKSFLMSNPASRLMTGNSTHYTQLERTIADLYGKESALVLSCGFMLNSGALPALVQPNDYIIADRLVHASLIDGIRLCECSFSRFRHNDIDHLRSLLTKTQCDGTVYVVLESIYSMDGDCVPLEEIIKLKKEFGFKIYLDEAHAFGVHKLGIAQRDGLLSEIDYLVVTMGKAAASTGAFIVLDALSREVLINRMRTLIFSTALPPISLMWSQFVVERIGSFDDRRAHLAELCELLSQAVERITGQACPKSHIIPIIVGDNGACMELAERFRENGFWVTAIRYPTVAKDSARLRVSLSASLTQEDILRFIDVLEHFYHRLKPHY